VKWLTPRAYRRWRDVGLAGYLADGLPQRHWRGRTDGRNLSLSELLWASGLRLREAGTLLLPELPSASGEQKYVRGRVAESVAKGTAREYWVSSKSLQRINGYVKSDRAAAVARAQSTGRYDQVLGKRIVTSINARGDVTLRDNQGREAAAKFDMLDAESRSCLFKETLAGLEPLSVWLTEAGDPMPYLSWETVFSRASDRCEQQDVPIRCHPHMLRHSFALRMLVTLTYAFDRRLGLSEAERLEYRHLFGDPWVLVQTMLGHRSLSTTRSYYLEPVQGLQVDMFLNDDSEENDVFSVEQLIARVAAASPLVQDVADRYGAN
jgi:site-specific recombinase XerD